jgi:hypothetical protein
LNVVWNEFFLHGSNDHAEQIWDAIALAFWLRRQQGVSLQDAPFRMA